VTSTKPFCFSLFALRFFLGALGDLVVKSNAAGVKSEASPLGRLSFGLIVNQSVKSAPSAVPTLTPNTKAYAQ
jgi:hypothetical protein